MKQRPTGVTVLAILEFVAAAGMALGGLLLIVGIGILGAAVHSQGKMGMGAMIVGLGVAGGIALLIFSVIPGAVGFGLWKLQNWARILCIIFACLGALGNTLRLMMGLTHFHMFGVVGAIFGLGINALIIWYLLQPEVKQAFGTA